ncbi:MULTISPECIES: rhodanese-like domain-containing protein [Actinosynnema]|uniref:rhodanese-like domain-containing protein n=1 Tax=Actinosynnema TaxID=40566 RepID=UPI0020A4211D|nr:rhodanese-like domain-containing protein [Actinosynnema pretiosum]
MGPGGASALDGRLARAREGLDRLSPQRLHELLGDAPGDATGSGDATAPGDASGSGRADVLVVDIRPEHNRAAEGEIPGSVPVERIVLEWRLDPFGEFRLPGFTAATRVVVVCNEGYASSLAARDLRELGLPLATDLAGGFRGYAAAGLPVRPGPTDPVR